MDGHYPDCATPTDCWCEVRRLSRVLGVALIVLCAEILGGYFSESLALLADAGHVFADNTAIVVAITTALLVKIHFQKKRTRVIGFTINVTLLFAVVFMIFVEALGRIENPRDIDSLIMISVAILGAIGNYVQHKILEGAAHEHKHQIHHSISLHVLSDLFMSLGVIVGGIVIWATGWTLLDPIISMGIALWIAYRTAKLLRDPHGKHDHHHH